MNKPLTISIKKLESLQAKDERPTSLQQGFERL